ncbi:hypothetical protein [Lentilactobacillus sp. Marseille-Q4993]|uniref:hypothetical protein n=1 Tax=Lentilactobacillus sp. Marseille-Q4993 TaxID=3039492 RepID=UPI0024BC10D3|nr:hypothetical protein [Lentilactobacillus sp. Marseille-Q4993]
MPYSYLDIVLPNKQSEEKLQAAFFQINLTLDSFVDEIRVNNPRYNRPSFYIENLGLTENEHNSIVNYFKENYQNSIQKNTDWLSKWLNENIYEMPNDYILRMVNSYCHWCITNNKEDQYMPNNWQDIQLSDKKSQDALQAVLFQINSVMVDIVEEIKMNNPDFKLPFQWVVGLSQDENSLILQHFIFNKNEKDSDSIAWLTNWLSQHDYSVSQDSVKQIVSNIRDSIKLMN